MLLKQRIFDGRGGSGGSQRVERNDFGVVCGEIESDVAAGNDRDFLPPLVRASTKRGRLIGLDDVRAWPQLEHDSAVGGCRNCPRRRAWWFIANEQHMA